MKCHCGYEDDSKKWILLELTSNSSNAYFVGYKYDEEKDKRDYWTGGLKLLVCPKCKSVKLD